MADMTTTASAAAARLSFQKKASGDDVQLFLVIAGAADYYERFMANGYDAMDTVATLNEKDLDELDIRDPAVRTALLTAVKRLQESSTAEDDNDDNNLPDLQDTIIIMPTEKAPLTPAELRELKRVKACEELHETEKSYSKNLYILKSQFSEPMKQIIGADVTAKLFMGLPEIFELSKNMMHRLNRCFGTQARQASPLIGSIFVELGPYFKIYGQYVDGMPAAKALLQELVRTKAKLAEFITNTQREHSKLMNNLRLEDFLIMPVQRVPRYEMLLKTILKYTLPESPDYEPLTKAIALIERVAADVNRPQMKQAEASGERLLELQSRISKLPESLMSPGRKLIHEGLLKVWGKDKEYYFFLFNDILIQTTRAKVHITVFGHSYEFLAKMPLDCTGAMPLDDMDDRSLLIDSRGLKKALHLYASTPEEKNQWLRLLNEHAKTYRKQQATLQPKALTAKMAEMADNKMRPRNSSGNFRLSAEFSDDEFGQNRARLWNDMLKTEVEFVKKLGIISGAVDALAALSKKKDAGFTEGVVNEIFFNVNKVFTVHTEVLRQMNARRGIMDPIIGDMFLDMIPKLTIHVAFVGNYVAAEKRLTDETAKASPLAKAVTDTMGKLQLQDRAILDTMVDSVQRIQQYRTQLEEYLKYVETSSPDFDYVNKARSGFQELSSKIDAEFWKQADRIRLMDIQKNTTGLKDPEELTASDKTLVRDDMLVLVRGNVQKPMAVFLFTDCLYLFYVVSGPTLSYRFFRKIALSVIGAVSNDASDDHQFTFTIITADKSYRFAAGSNKVKAAWLTDIGSANINNSGSGLGKLDSFSVAQTWQEYSATEVCTSCKTPLRKYHCRSCGNIFCPSCAPCRSVDPTMRVRVCSTCMPLGAVDIPNALSMSSSTPTGSLRLRKSERSRVSVLFTKPVTFTELAAAGAKGNSDSDRDDEEGDTDDNTTSKSWFRQKMNKNSK